MTSLPQPDQFGPVSIRWVALDDRTWEARIGPDLVGTVVFGARYVVRSTHDQGLTGFHTSLESAKAQLEAWVRWQDGLADTV